MSDLISRADAIEAVVSWTVEDRPHEVMPTDLVDRINALPSADAEPKRVLQGYCKGANTIQTIRHEELQSIANTRKAVESADAVQGWIPCSERLPSESGDYLCTIPLDADETYTEVLMFHKGRFYEDDAEWGATYHDDVLAWMPLPTPYKGGDTE